MELIIKWEGKEHSSREGADLFAFEIKEPEDSKHLQIWVSEDVQEAIKDRYGDDFALVQVVLGKARQHLQTAAALDPIVNIQVHDKTNPLGADLVSAVDLYCHHLIGRDQSARCQIGSGEFSNNPNGCIPSKNTCWRQIHVKD